jgi:hypothetical protein
MSFLHRRGLMLGACLLAGSLILPLNAAGAGAVPVTPAAATAPTLIVLTNSSDGTTVVARVGDFVEVELTGGPLRWTEASTSDTAVVTKVSGGVSSAGSSSTTFKVVGYGTAELTALGSPICGGSVCPEYVVLWHASVVVPVVDPPIPGSA